MYVGQTGRTPSHRLKEHRRALTRGNLTQSVLVEDAAAYDHAIELGSFKAVDVHRQSQQLCLLESWHIRSQDVILNREEGKLPLVYNQLNVKTSRPNTALGSHRH